MKFIVFLLFLSFCSFSEGKSFKELIDSKISELKYKCLKKRYGTACYELGLMYETGKLKIGMRSYDVTKFGVKRDLEKAEEWYLVGCSKNHYYRGLPCYKYGEFLYEGRGSSKDEHLGLHYLKLSCEKARIKNACKKLAEIYESKDDIESAFRYARRLISGEATNRIRYKYLCESKKKADSCYLVGVRYGRNEEEKKKYLDRACRLGNFKGCYASCEKSNAFGCFKVGEAYAKERNVQRALTFFDKACKLGHPQACKKAESIKLAIEKERKRREEERKRLLAEKERLRKLQEERRKRYMEKLKSLEAKCKRGNVQACGDAGAGYLELGNRKLNVRFVEKGIKLLDKACSKRNYYACALLGAHYVRTPYRSRGIPYLKKACSANVGDACAVLGMVYMRGWGVKMDKITAYKYLIKGAKLGSVEAQNTLDKLCKESPWVCNRKW